MDAHDKAPFNWRYEAAWPLLWALQHMDGMLGPPREPCDVDPLIAVVRDTPNLDDLAAKGLRSANDILCEAATATPGPSAKPASTARTRPPTSTAASRWSATRP